MLHPKIFGAKSLGFRPMGNYNYLGPNSPQDSPNGLAAMWGHVALRPSGVVSNIKIYIPENFSTNDNGQTHRLEDACLIKNGDVPLSC